MSRRRALIVVNRRATRGKADLLRGLAILDTAGIDATLVLCRQAERIPEVIRQGAPGADLLILGGGDGTLSTACDAILDTGLPLGILPLGNANDLARTLGIPANPAAACGVIAAGSVRWIDLGWVNGTHFFNVASVGLSVLVARRLRRQVKRRWGLLGYLHCLWEVVHRVSDFSVSILCDGSVEQRRSLQVAVGNGRFYGGGMVIMDDASIDDGRLDIYSLDPQPRWRLIVLFPALLRGGHRQLPGVFTERGEHVRLETDPPRSINIDGEIRARTPAEFRVVPHALRVFAPRRGG